MHIIIGFAILVVVFSLFPRVAILFAAVGAGALLLAVIASFALQH